MNALKRLRQTIGARGDWNDRGRCMLKAGGLTLERADCEAARGTAVAL
jgi:hypothetical protein